MSYYRGQPPRGPPRYDNHGPYSNPTPYPQGGQQWRDDRGYYDAGRPPPATYPPRQYPPAQPQHYSRPASPPPPPLRSPRTKARDVLEDPRASKDAISRASKVLLDDAKSSPQGSRSMAALASYFPRLAAEQQEEVIDVVYDLCEDTNQAVRIQGYNTIVELSKKVPTWTRRNADVLVQLLQSDSTSELQVIREALISHIQTDPVAAFEVIAEHIVRAGEAEEQSADAAAGGMKRLVVEFLSVPQVVKARKDYLVAGSDAEAAFNQGISEALVYSTPHDVMSLISLLRSLPSWTSTEHPNDFRTQAISLLLQRSTVFAVTPAGEHVQTDDSLHFYNLARDLAADGQGDPRAFVLFWSRIPWKHWATAQRSEYGRMETLLSWLNASTVIWDNIRRGRRAIHPDENMFEEESLAKEVLKSLLELYSSAVDVYDKDGPARQEEMWSFVASVMAIFNALARMRVVDAPLRDAFTSGKPRRLVEFAYATHEQRGSGIRVETRNLLKSIVAEHDKLCDELRIDPPAIKTQPTAPSAESSARVSPVVTGIKRNVEGHRLVEAAFKRPPVKIERDRSGKERQEPLKGPLFATKSYATDTQASPMPRREPHTPIVKNLQTSREETSLEERPAKRAKPNPMPTSSIVDSKPVQPQSLLERINSSSHRRTPDPNGTKPATTQAQPLRSLAERLGISVTQAPSRSSTSDPPISIRGAAEKGMRNIERTTVQNSLLSRIGAPVNGDGKNSGQRGGKR